MDTAVGKPFKVFQTVDAVFYDDAGASVGRFDLVFYFDDRRSLRQPLNASVDGEMLGCEAAAVLWRRVTHRTADQG